MATTTVKMIGFQRRSGKRSSGIGPAKARALLAHYQKAQELWKALEAIAAPEPTLACAGVVSFEAEDRD